MDDLKICRTHFRPRTVSLAKTPEVCNLIRDPLGNTCWSGHSELPISAISANVYLLVATRYIVFEMTMNGVGIRRARSTLRQEFRRSVK